MTALEALEKRIMSLYLNGKTDKEIAGIAGCSIGHINHIRNHTRPIGGVSIDLMLKLFPDLDKAIADACNGTASNSNIASGNISGTVTQTIGSGNIDAYQLKLYKGLAALDIPDDAKSKVLSLIKDAAK